MGRGPKIKPDVRKTIIGRALEKKDLKTKAEDLAKKVRKELLADRKTAPAVSTITKLITKTRNQEPSPQDKPWSLATLGNSPIPSAALPVVLRTCEDWNKCQGPNVGPFSIRQAKWVSRLYTLVQDNDLFNWASYYALSERVYDLMGKLSDFESSKMDRQVLQASRYPWLSGKVQEIVEENPDISDSELEKRTEELVRAYEQKKREGGKA